MLQNEQLVYNFFIALSFSIIGIIFIIIFLVLYFSNQQKKSKLSFEKYKVEKENEILITQLEIQEDIFSKISREIHDNISLGLTLAKLQINTHLEQSKIKSEILSSSIDLISKSLVDLNDISKSLDAKKLLSQGLINALESEISVLNKLGKYIIEFNISGDPKYLNSEIDLILLRIFQEAFNNIIKHAEATHVSINLIYSDEFLTMKIIDNGRGFDAQSIEDNKELRKMSGIKNFYARAEVIKAEIEITSKLNSGTTITIKTPIKNQEYHAK